jgi:hypothetical protein
MWAVGNGGVIEPWVENEDIFDPGRVVGKGVVWWRTGVCSHHGLGVIYERKYPRPRFESLRMFGRGLECIPVRIQIERCDEVETSRHCSRT